MTDYKELCAELVTELEGWCGTGTYDNTVNAHSVIDRARDALAQPEPETGGSLTYYPKVTRVEVITSKGREFVRHECAHVQFSLQDDGRTIKVFLSSND
jgi:hypothetical protein